MAEKRSRKLFVNLAVRDLKKSMHFFTKLGFEFNPKFTDDKAACMIISEEAFVMLLGEPFFRTFTKQELCDTTKHTEGLFALSCDSRAEVDEMVKKAVAAGGKDPGRARPRRRLRCQPCRHRAQPEIFPGRHRSDGED